jgi:hypothetical protein
MKYMGLVYDSGSAISANKNTDTPTWRNTIVKTKITEAFQYAAFRFCLMTDR